MNSLEKHAAKKRLVRAMKKVAWSVPNSLYHAGRQQARKQSRGIGAMGAYMGAMGAKLMRPKVKGPQPGAVGAVKPPKLNLTGLIRRK